MKGEQEVHDDQEGEDSHQDGSALAVMDKKKGAHDTGVEQVGREEQQAYEQQHRPDPQIA